MTLWSIFALMTAAAIFAVLWPLVRRPRLANSASGADLAIYRDQLDEIERDLAASLIGATEAVAARVEVSRRMISAFEHAKPKPAAPDKNPNAKRRRVAAVILALLVPAIAIPVYLRIGSPKIPSAPFVERAVESPELQAINKMIAQAQARLERNPEDGRVWDALARLYMRVDRNEDSVMAWQTALRLLGENADREEGLGEALLALTAGVVTIEAKEAFARAVALDRNAVAARFYLGLAAEQEGKRDEAAGIWRDLIAAAPAGSPWVGSVRDALARVEGKPADNRSGPGGGDRAAADSLTPEQIVKIRAMVERLAERLKRDGGDVEGWLQLVRSYAVLGDAGRARDAAINARNAIGQDSEKLRRLNEGARELGVAAE
jgi:cytochrome c-type biogenesis protein CcmH